MTDKIRIVGSFGEGAADKVREFVKGLDGVQTVSVLRDGVETYSEADPVQAEQGTPATPTTPPTPETTPQAERELADLETAATRFADAVRAEQDTTGGESGGAATPATPTTAETSETTA